MRALLIGKCDGEINKIDEHEGNHLDAMVHALRNQAETLLEGEIDSVELWATKENGEWYGRWIATKRTPVVYKLLCEESYRGQ